MTEQEQIEEMAKVIRPILENRTDICFIPDLDKPIAEELLKHYQPKLSKDSIVLTREEYTNYMVEYMGVKEIKDRVSKETAEKIFAKVLEWSPIGEDYHWFITTLENWLKEHYGVEV